MSALRPMAATAAAPAIPRPRGVVARRRRVSRWRLAWRGSKWYATKWSRQALRCLTEPSEAFWELKRTGDWRAVPVFLALALAARMLTLQFTGLPFVYERAKAAAAIGKFEPDQWVQYFIQVVTIGMTDFYYSSLPEDVSAILEFLRIVVPFGTWLLAHYAIAQIFYGEGGMKDIAVSAAFSLTPFILLSWPAALILTNVLSLEEKGIWFSWSFFVNLWVIFLFYKHQEAIHDFTPGRAILVWVLSLISVVLLWALLALLAILTSSTWEFFKELLYEVVAR